MYKALLGIHILAASVALIAGMIAIVAKKNKGLHTSAGLAYYGAMYGTTISAVIMSAVKWNPFLFSVGIFALYLTYAGKKAIWYKRLKTAYIPTLTDRLPAIVGLLTSVGMLCYPAYKHVRFAGPLVSVLQVFGFILLLFSIKDLQLMAKPENFGPAKNKIWLPRHIASMGGAYISTITAFLVVNINITPAWIVWLSPTVVGSILISVTITKMKGKKKKPAIPAQ